MKLDWRHITLIILSVLLVVLILILTVMFLSKDEVENQQEASLLQAEESSAIIEESKMVEESAVLVLEEESNAAEENSEQSNTEESSQEEESKAEQEESAVNQEESSEPEEDDEPSQAQQEQPTAIEIPYAIPGTSLVIKQYNSYDGIFLEDGSDSNVTGIGAIVVENTGSVGVEYADIMINQSGTMLKFTASALPAGTMIVIQEASGAAYSDAAIQECSANVALIDHFEMSSSLIEVVENESGTLSVTNIGSETIPCVRIFYKFALEKGSIYVGGITYTAKIVDLEPGVTQEIAPSHYEAGSSEIMMIRTYNTAE